MVLIDDTDWYASWGDIYDTYGNEISNSNWSEVVATTDVDDFISDTPVNSSSSTYDYGGSGASDAKFRLGGFQAGETVDIHLDSLDGPQMVVSPTVAGGANFKTRSLVFPYNTFIENTKFNCSISAPSNIPVGTSTDIDVAVTNNGGGGTKEIELTADGNFVDSSSVSISSGQSTTLTFSYTPDSEGTVDLEADIAVGGRYYETDGHTSQTVEAVNPYFDVSIVDTNSPLAGNTLDVTANISETAGVSGTKDVELIVDGSVQDTITVSLSGDGSEQKVFNWNTSSGDGGSYTATVSSPDGSDSSPVTIIGPSYEITITDTNSPITARDTLNVTADLTNNGGAGTETVTLNVGGSQRDSAPISLGINESDSYTLSWDTLESDFGSYTATYNSPSSSDTTSVSVEIPPPVNLTVDDSIENELTISWDEVREDAGYYVYRAESSFSDTANATQVANVTSPTYTDTGVEDGKQYYYRVTSEN